MVQKGLAAVVFAPDDLADENLVVAPRKDIDDLAVEEGKAIREDRRGGCCRDEP
jgi:hypothetical protein